MGMLDIQVTCEEFPGDSGSGCTTYTGLIEGDDLTKEFTIVNPKASRDVQVVIRQDFAPYKEVYPSPKYGEDVITVEFFKAPATGENYKVIIQ